MLDSETPIAARRRNALDWIEWAGNKLPEPAILFAYLAGIVILLSALGSWLGWSVQPVQPVVLGTDAAGEPILGAQAVGSPIEPRSLLNGDGVYWMLSSMLRNFVGLPSVPLIFTAMLGIGLAEKFGLFGALMRALATVTPPRLLTPVVVFIGANASVASDAGYIILPPLAAALYLAMGRHPIAGLAAAFAGVAGGFGAGFFPNGSDGAIAGFAQDAARIIDPAYNVTILHNYYFKATSAIVVTLAGWYVTDRIVEPRLNANPDSLDRAVGEAQLEALSLKPEERSALRTALWLALALIGLAAALIYVPGMPLHGPGQQTLASGRVLVQESVLIAPAGTPAPAEAGDVYARTPLSVVEAPGNGRLLESPGPRWSHVIVPLIFLVFAIPGAVYGRLVGTCRSQKDLVDGLYSGIRSIVPVLVIAFFMAQFVNYFSYTNLDRMLAYSGGSLLVEAQVPIVLLIVLFVLLVIFGDFAISGMLSKFGVLAPIFIPMFMLVGKSPELTTAAYRIGDSVVNIVTPLNSYLLIILAMLQKYRREAGLGTLIALMLPYTFFLTIAWTATLVIWYLSGANLGPGAPLEYLPPR